MTEHLIDAIEETIFDTHDIDVTDRDFAKAIVAALPGMIAPLEWEDDEQNPNIKRSGIYSVYHCGCRFGGKLTWIALFGPNSREWAASEDQAKAAADAHHRAAIMAAFVPPEGDG